MRNKRDITLLERLGSGAHSEVFRATIDGSAFAVKLVCPPFIIGAWAWTLLRRFQVPFPASH